MQRLLIRPAGLFSRKHVVEPFDGMTAMQQIALFERDSYFSEWSTLYLGEMVFRLDRERRWSGPFRASSNGVVYAWAHKPSVLSNRFEVQSGANAYLLQPRGGFSRAFVIYTRQLVAGEILPKSVWSQAAIMVDHIHMPLLDQLFMAWLVLRLWQRNNSSG